MRGAATMNRLPNPAELARGEYVSAEEVAEAMRRRQAPLANHHACQLPSSEPQVPRTSWAPLAAVIDVGDAHSEPCWNSTGLPTVSRVRVTGRTAIRFSMVQVTCAEAV